MPPTSSRESPHSMDPASLCWSLQITELLNMALNRCLQGKGDPLVPALATVVGHLPLPSLGRGPFSLPW